MALENLDKIEASVNLYDEDKWHLNGTCDRTFMGADSDIVFLLLFAVQCMYSSGE